MSKRRSVLTLGNFDGVHVGHVALLDAARAIADDAGLDVIVLTFQQHPARTLRPDKAPPLLMDAPQKMGALLDAGADQIEWLPTDKSIFGLSPRAFVERMVDRYAPVAWVEGHNFRFGKGRAGDLDTLRELGGSLDYRVEVVEPVEVTLRDKTCGPVSSSLIRWLIAAGRVADAQVCLGKPYVVRGEVIEGAKRGRAIGFPTANLDTGERVLPAEGVYGGEVDIDGATHLAAISVGTNPTFDGVSRTFEAFVLDFDGDLYGRTLDVRVVRWLREQQTFVGVDPLVEQVHRDVAQIRKLHAAGMLSAAEQVVTA